MKIELRPLVEVKPYEKNPRLNDQAVEAVARSIEQFGFRHPIVVDCDGGDRHRAHMVEGCLARRSRCS